MRQNEGLGGGALGFLAFTFGFGIRSVDEVVRQFFDYYS
jgi:hypothetical protein